MLSAGRICRASEEKREEEQPLDYWRGIVNTILYSVQFEAELDVSVANRIAEGLLERPVGLLSADDEYTSLAAGLRSGAPLPTLVQMRHPADELREFLALVVDRMDSMRPWPVPPYVQLPDEYFTELHGSLPIARISHSPDETAARLSRGFSFDGQGLQYLLLRLRSGIVVGFVSPYWNGSADVAVFCIDPDRNGDNALRELMDTGRLAPGAIFELEEAGTLPTATRYDTTPMHPEFRGENLPGNTVWRGARVDYLDYTARQHFRLHGYGGALQDSKGTLFDTTAAVTLWTPHGGRAIFVMDHDGYLYSAPFHIVGKFHPSSLLAGAPVAGAGEIQAVAGQVLLISDRGNHYRPARHYTMQVIDSLRRQGLDVSNCRVEYHSES